MKKILIVVCLSIITMFSLGGCGSSSSLANTTNNAKAVTLNISAAASLTDSLNAVEAEYKKDNANIKFTNNYGASGTLEQQIEQGAPVDLFISADTTNMNKLKDKSLVDEKSIVNILKNEVVLIVPTDSKLELKSFLDLTKDSVEHIAVGEPAAVPAGKYAEQVFDALNITEKVKSKEILGKDVKEVLSWVEEGNADAGIVYSTDAKTSKKVKIVATAPKGSHKEVVYPGAVVKATKNSSEANKFLKFLSSSQAKAIFKKYGFITN
jgi:molybdate transport system substrate-binding protein